MNLEQTVLNAFQCNYREPVDPWPGECQVLGGPNDGKFFPIQGSGLVYIKANRPTATIWNPDECSPFDTLNFQTVVCTYERYIWYEYFQYLWIFVPIEVFIRTYAIDPELKSDSV
jgi:hypothetical protein